MITSSTTTAHNFDATANMKGDSAGVASSRGFAFYDPQPVQIQILTPKKPRVLHLERARLKEQLKVWGLRKR